jgi:hypothetical protein
MPNPIYFSGFRATGLRLKTTSYAMFNAIYLEPQYWRLHQYIDSQSGVHRQFRPIRLKKNIFCSKKWKGRDLKKNMQNNQELWEQAA